MNKITIKELHIHNPGLCDVKVMFKRLELLIGKLLMQVSELKAKLDEQTARVEKIAGEIVVLKDFIENNDFALPQEIVDSVSRLDAALKAADDLNPDQPAAEPAPETVEG